MKNVLITGATGFLGSYLLKELLEDKNVCPIVIARSKKDMTVADRMDGVLRYFYGENSKEFLKRIKIIEGEVDKESMGIDSNTRAYLIDSVDEIYHSAAIAQFRVPLEKIRKTNVDGARRVFDLAMECRNNGRFKKVNHISTTYVVGTRQGVAYERELSVGQGFNNTYEQTKFEAELLACEYRKKGLNISIFRPSILTGDSISGKTSNFKMLYQPLHFLAEELFEAAPVDRFSKENLMPVDTAAKAIVALASIKESTDKTYHISHPDTVEIGHFIDLASDFFGFKKPEMAPLRDFNMDRMSVVQKKLIGPYVPYFNYNIEFNSLYTQNILKKIGLEYPPVNDKFLLKLFAYCLKSGFIKRKKLYATCG